MKIAYIAYWDMGHESGVLKKIVGQIREWQARGNSVELFALTPVRSIWEGASNISVRLFPRGNALTRFYRARKFVHGVAQSQPDISYMRFNTFFPAFRNLAEQVPLILEINTDDVLEYRRTLPPVKYLYHRLTRNLLLKKASGFVFMTNELADRFAGYNKPSITLGNGIEFSTCALSPPHDNPQPRLVFLGSDGLEWHGIDEVLELARLRPLWKFDIIGPAFAPKGGLVSDNVVFHSFLKHSEYKGILQSADFGLGTLGLFRKGMNEACPLKVREYLAYGLPSIIGYRDTDFPDGVPFLLNIGNAPGNIRKNLLRIDDFVRSWKGKRVPRSQVTHLDVRQKEKTRLGFFEFCMANFMRHNNV